uniref:Tyrosine--tRNA ligase n=1 Tax=Rhabditophanes sp. KR3021 TaxID=114890 RepID=A0AC35TRR3_9BILA
MTDKKVVEMTEEDNSRFDLITRNLQEYLGGEKIKTQLASNKNMHLYWGTAPTGKPHVGYMVPMRKIADFLQAGVKVSILFADVHAYLDNMKSSFKVLEKRTQYYEIIITSLMKALDVPIQNLTFVKGSSYQMNEAYTQDVLKLCGQVSERDALKAGAEVVKQVASPLLSGLLYPLLQALDEQYLKVDGQFGGVDQRKIFILAEEQLPKLKLGKRWHLMNPMVPGLKGSKMSASEADSKIDLFDTPETVNKKVDAAICPVNSTENGILALYKYVIFPIMKQSGIQFDGTNYDAYEPFEKDFNAGTLSELTIKSYFKTFLNDLLGKVQAYAKEAGGAKFDDIIRDAYPLNVDDSQVAISPLVENETQFENAYNTILDMAASFNDAPEVTPFISANSRICLRISPKGKVHLGHVLGLYRLKRFAQKGFDCSILISDVDAFLNNEKCPWKALVPRTQYYTEVLTQLKEVVGGLSEVPIVYSTANQWKPEFTLDMYKLASKITRDDSAIVKGTSLATHLVVLYYALDMHYNKFTVSIVTEEERPLAQVANDLLSSVGYPIISNYFIKALPGMDGKAMSSTGTEFALDPLETAKQTKTKIGKSFCEPGNVDDTNIALRLINQLIFQHPDNHEQFTLLIERTQENGGNLECSSFNELQQIFKQGSLHPADLKAYITWYVNTKIFDPVRLALGTSQTKLLKEAFPPITKKK